ncbi:MAG TPA: hypothetical protein PLN19_03090 [Methanothrix sp.]|jgi:RPA family protein|nr:hypothetical protein [Methanothrix sp.]HOV81890.1 hypothetical protein [Methanothrix sp.]HQE87241.1 hypothetical protein [Methanothrix sp.]HQI67297.1 hypothetical protein [Methanothrix sp.]HRS84280.1 hypothetical protein [Methanothrix sp.]
MAGFSREVAKRVFAEELKSSNCSFRDGEEQNQYAPSYLLTPTGAKCNRVFVVGTLTEKDDIGTDTEYWRGRVVDPTGSIFIYAGQYQPEAAQTLAGLEPPEFVAVVGKPNLYQTEEGKIIITIRAESIQKVDRTTKNQWVLDTAARTLERLAELKSVMPAQISGDFSTADAIPAAPRDGQRAMDHYHTDIEHYRQMVLRALVSLADDLGQAAAPSGMPDIISGSPVGVPSGNGEASGGKSETGGTASAVAPALDEKPAAASRRPRQKKDEPLRSWSDLVGEEDVETFDFGKKS